MKIRSRDYLRAVREKSGLKDIDPPPSALCITAGCRASRMEEPHIAAFIGALQVLAQQE